MIAVEIRAEDISAQRIASAIAADSGNSVANYTRYAESLSLTLSRLSPQQLNNVFTGSSITGGGTIPSGNPTNGGNSGDNGNSGNRGNPGSGGNSNDDDQASSNIPPLPNDVYLRVITGDTNLSRGQLAELAVAQSNGLSG